MLTDTHEVTLQGVGPLDGQQREISAVMATEIPVECPWGPGEVFHFALARYLPDGRWSETRCGSTDTGDVLKETP